MNKTKALKILAEFQKRQPINLFSGPYSFKEQNDFILDPSKQKFALTCRRSGKSYAAALMAMNECIHNSTVTVAYIGLTRESSKNIILPHLKEIKKNFKVNCKFMSSPAEVRFSNGSVIKFFGIDDSESEREKLLGQHFKLVIIDEVASMTIDLQATIRDYIKPTLMDDEGTLVLTGTPGNLRNYYCDISEGRIPGWSGHFWLADKNPKVAKQYLKEIEELKQLYPNILNDSGFQQHYLGKWTIDTDKKLYKASPDNYIKELPPGDYQYLLSLDLGWNDDNAFTVGAFKEFDNTLYIVHCYKQPKMIVDTINNKIKELEKLYPFTRIVIDSANKQFVQELTYRTGRHFTPAAKTDKLNYIHLMNSDFICLKIKIVEPLCKDLIKEYDSLTILDDKTNNYQTAIGNQIDHCFIAGTKIKTINGDVNIEDVKENTLVLTRSGYFPVKASAQTGIYKVYKLTTSNNDILIGTANHPIFANNKFTNLSELKPYDILTCISLHQEQICQNKNFAQCYVVTIQELNISLPVYNLSVDSVNEYFANNILVHNCSDSSLYLWRESYNYNNKPEEPKVNTYSEQKVDEFWSREADKLQNKQEQDFFEKDWD